MTRRSVAVLAALAAVPATMLASTAVTSSGNPVASAVHSITQARLVDANTYSFGSNPGGGGGWGWCPQYVTLDDGTQQQVGWYWCWIPN